MKTLAVILLPLVCAAATAPSALDGLIDSARGAPGEFAADALIRIAALDKLEKTRRIELLDQAFQRASEAQQPFKRHAVTVRLDGPTGYLNRAYDQDLDGLSLRLRAIEIMLPLDGRKARDLFLQISPLQVPKVDCKEFLVYDVGRFYEVASKIASQTFSPKEVQQHEPERMLERFAGAITSPAQVAPVARMAVEAGLKDEEFQSLVTMFAGQLGRISGDDRSYSYTTRAVGVQIFKLIEECKRRQISLLPLLEAYRLYLINNLSAKRCADDDVMQGGGSSFGLSTGRSVDQEAADAVAFFNQSLRVPPIQALQDEEISPSGLEGTASGLRSCQDPECIAIAGQYRSLIFDTTGLPYTADQRSKPEWQTKLREFLSAMAEWKQSTGVTEAGYYREKSGTFGEVLNLVINTPQRDEVMFAMLDYARQSRFQTENRVEWFLPVNALIGRIGLDPLGLGKTTDALRRTEDPLIALYVSLEAVAPRDPSMVMKLL
jgi:hypothetical protein